MKCDKNYMKLYAVTDSEWTCDKTLEVQVREAIKGGVTCVQLREKNLNYDDFLKQAIALKDICKKYNVPLIINDNVQIAIECKADGIHVGQGDMEATSVREKIGDDMMLGVSVKTLDQAKLAEKNGADYLGVGAVFQTSTKLDATSVSHSTLKDICTNISIPVVAIGGIYKHNIMELKGCGVDGVALVSAIFSSENIENECKELLRLSEKMIIS